jgi:hypothetical protein
MGTFIPTAGEIVTGAYRLLNAIDTTEVPTATEMQWGIDLLNDLYRSTHADGCSQYQIQILPFTIPALRQNFTIGDGANYDINIDAVVFRRLDMADFGNTMTRRETRAAPKVDVRRTLFPGLIVKWHQETQSDGSLKIWVWQPPRMNAKCEIEIGGRLPVITSSATAIPLPPEGVTASKYILAKAVRGQTGRPIAAVQDVITQADQFEASWRTYARGVQWLRMLR